MTSCESSEGVQFSSSTIPAQSDHPESEMSNNVGALPPPPGVIPNFEHPDNALNRLNLVVQILIMSVVSPFVFLRLATALFLQRHMNKEDWSCVVAWVFFMMYSISAILMGHFGGGIHQWEVTNANLEGFFKVVYGGSLIYGLTAYSIKVTLLLIFTRLFALMKKATFAIYAFIFAMLCYYLIMLAVKARICDPIPSFWDRTISGTCFDEHALFIADTTMSGITDVAVLVFPIPLVRKLNMPFRKKVRVFCFLGAGGVAVAASLARLVMVVKEGNDPDLTYSIVRFNLLGSAETSIGLICASLPACSALFARFGCCFVPQASKSKISTPSTDIEQGLFELKSSKVSMRAKISKLQPGWTYDEMNCENDVPVYDRHEIAGM